MNATQNSDCISTRPPEASRLARLTGIGLLLVGGMFMCSTVEAGSIYKCPLPNSTYQYTDVPCRGPHASVVHVNTKSGNGAWRADGDRQTLPAKFRDAQGGAPQTGAQSRGGEALYGNTALQQNHGSAKPARSDLRLDTPGARRMRTRVLQAADVPPSAYECTAGPKHWIQMAPCPQVNLEDPRDTTDDPSVDDGSERGSYVLLDRVPVRQQPLDKSDLCRKLDDNSIPMKHTGGSDVYERNVERSRYCP